MKKIILSALACTALLTGCVSQDKGNAMQSQLNNQQRQINELSVRLQSAESRLSKQEEKLRNELLQSSGYCYLNGARYSTGTVLGVRLENGIYGHSRFCNTDFDDKLACLNLSGV